MQTLRKLENMADFYEDFISFQFDNLVKEKTNELEEQFRALNRDERKKSKAQYEKNVKEVQEIAEDGRANEGRIIDLIRKYTKRFSRELEQNESSYFVCKPENEGVSYVFNAIDSFFVHGKLPSLSGGNYQIWGKVIRKHNGFNFFKNTSLSIFSNQLLTETVNKLLDSVEKEQIDLSGSIEPVLQGEVYEIYPIAIYI